MAWPRAGAWPAALEQALHSARLKGRRAQTRQGAHSIDRLRDLAGSRAGGARHSLRLADQDRAAADHRQQSMPPRESPRPTQAATKLRACAAPGDCPRLASISPQSRGIHTRSARLNPRGQRAQRSARGAHARTVEHRAGREQSQLPCRLRGSTPPWPELRKLRLSGAYADGGVRRGARVRCRRPAHSWVARHGTARNAGMAAIERAARCALPRSVMSAERENGRDRLDRAREQRQRARS
jgi:hypothetical protein